MHIGRIRPGWGPVSLLSALALSVFFAPIPAIPLAGQTISGRLLDSDTRTPVVSGTVVLFDTVGIPVARAVTDSAGHFVLRAPGLGRFALRARGAGYRGSLESRFDLTAEEEVETDVLLVPEAGRAGGTRRTAPGTSVGEPQAMRGSAAVNREAGDTTITGVVRDSVDGRPLPGVFFRIEGRGIGAVSDSSGIFSLPNVPEGEHVLLCDALGYTPRTIPISVPLPEPVLEVTLSVDPIELAPLEVRVNRVIRQLDARLRGYQTTSRVAGADLLREMDDVPDPKFALLRMGLGEGECVSGDCLRMFGKSKPVQAVVDGFPVSFNEFRAIPVRDICRIEAIYYWRAGSHTVIAYTCSFLLEHAQGLAPVVPDWWPWGGG